MHNDKDWDHALLIVAILIAAGSIALYELLGWLWVHLKPAIHAWTA